MSDDTDLTASLEDIRKMKEAGLVKPPVEDAPEREMPDGLFDEAE